MSAETEFKWEKEGLQTRFRLLTLNSNWSVVIRETKMNSDLKFYNISNNDVDGDDE